MNDGPKRSLGETVGQLLVIAILIALLIGAVILLRQFIDSHNSTGLISGRAAFTSSQRDFPAAGATVFSVRRQPQPRRG